MHSAEERAGKIRAGVEAPLSPPVPSLAVIHICSQDTHGECPIWAEEAFAAGLGDTGQAEAFLRDYLKGKNPRGANMPSWEGLLQVSQGHWKEARRGKEQAMGKEEHITPHHQSCPMSGEHCSAIPPSGLQQAFLAISKSASAPRGFVTIILLSTWPG